MARYIDADAIDYDDYWWNKGYSIKECQRAERLINEQPTADVRENVKGEWCVTPDGKMVCSNCFENPTNRIIVNGALVYDMTPIKEIMRFCPRCGAEMRGENK